MHIIHRQTYRVCGSPRLFLAIDLGEQYLQGSFVKEGHVIPSLRKIPTPPCAITRDKATIDAEIEKARKADFLVL
jgi:hypothetical protein